MAGRPKGAKNKRTLEREAHARAMASLVTQALGEDAFDGDAHALLMAVYKNNQAPIHLRVDAAKVAIRYEKPILASAKKRIDEGRDIVSKERRDAAVAAFLRARWLFRSFSP